jgi:hypothetical protein
MTFFPLGWLLNGIIVVIMEDFCPCLRKMVPRLFKEPSDTISTYRLLFKTRHVVNAVLIWSIATLLVLGNVMIYVLEGYWNFANKTLANRTFATGENPEVH